jgi:hypothetical protein
MTHKLIFNKERLKYILNYFPDATYKEFDASMGEFLKNDVEITLDVNDTKDIINLFNAGAVFGKLEN